MITYHLAYSFISYLLIGWDSLDFASNASRRLYFSLSYAQKSQLSKLHLLSSYWLGWFGFREQREQEAIFSPLTLRGSPVVALRIAYP